MFKILFGILAFNVVFSTCASNINYNSEIDRIGDAYHGFLEDYAVKVKLETVYENLALDIDIKVEILPKFSYHVSIEKDGIHQCSGAVVRIRYELVVITAASCVIGKGDLNVRYNAGIREEGGQVIDVNETFIHKDYKDHEYDIAVLQLNDRINVTESTILPEEPFFDNITHYRTNVSGWPTMYENLKKSSKNYLLYSELEIVDNNKCQPMNDTFMFCAGADYRNESFCHYNTGSPVVLAGRLIGFSMWDKGCRRHLEPSVFMKVKSAINWINTLQFK